MVEEFLEEPVKKRPYYYQLDVMKAIAIAFVVLDHSLTWEIKGAMGSVFWERLSIPFFLIVMGFNMGVSFQYRGTSRLKDLYSIAYFKRKIKRYVLPFIILYILSIILGITFGYLDKSERLWLLFLPFWGPGNWFIPLLFGSILVFPIIYWMFDRYPIITVGLCFLSELIMQRLLWDLYPTAATEYDWFVITAIRVNVLFFLPAVGIGLWFSRGYEPTRKRNQFIYPYLFISMIFMIDYATISPVTRKGIIGAIPNLIGDFFTFVQDFIRGDYTFLFYGYAAFLFLLFMMMIPQTASGDLQKFIERVGKSTYHILLFQIFWMSIVYWSIYQSAVMQHEIPQFMAELGWPSPLYYIPFYLLNVSVAFTGGMIWYEVERRVLYRKS
ncbi:MAG: acyltransferase family protein [Candidatus Thorarchaeota archaeon]